MPIGKTRLEQAQELAEKYRLEKNHLKSIVAKKDQKIARLEGKKKNRADRRYEKAILEENARLKVTNHEYELQLKMLGLILTKKIYESWRPVDNSKEIS